MFLFDYYDYFGGDGCGVVVGDWFWYWFGDVLVVGYCYCWWFFGIVVVDFVEYFGDLFV